MPRTRRPRVISPGVKVVMASARDARVRGGRWGRSDSPVMVVRNLVFSMPIWMSTGRPSVSIRWRNHSTLLGGRRMLVSSMNDSGLISGPCVPLCARFLCAAHRAPS
eukprot:scaffold76486_cov33-Attheya_sp.AAC.6